MPIHLRPTLSVAPRLHFRGCQALVKLGWRTKRGKSGRLVVDHLHCKSEGLTLHLRYSRSEGWYLEAEGDYLELCLRLAEFFETYYQHQIVTHIDEFTDALTDLNDSEP